MGEVSGITILFSPAHFLHIDTIRAGTVAATDPIHRAGHQPSYHILSLCCVP